MFLEKAQAVVDCICEWLGKISAIVFLLMMLNVFFDVIMRYLFNDVSIGMQELEWHFFAALFLLGTPYTLMKEGHVRVDFIYERLDPVKQAWINLIGSLILLLPFVLLVAYYGIPFTYESYQLGERSGDPGGLPYRWIIKGLIPFAFFMMGVSGVGLALRSINFLRRHKEANQ